MPTDLPSDAAKLRELVGAKRSAAAVAAVEEALESKWEGIQSVALRVLGSWGDERSIAQLRSFLQAAFERESAYAIRGVAVQELAHCVREADAGWVLDLYFSASGVLAKHELLRVVLALPPDAARERLVLESRSTSRDNRQAAMKALGNMAFSDRRALLEPFLFDQDPAIREGARVLHGRT